MRRGCAAVDGQRVEIAEDVEQDRAPVGRDVERWPRHFVGRERQGLAGFQHEAFVGAAAVGLRLLSGRRDEAWDGGEGGGNEQA